MLAQQGITIVFDSDVERDAFFKEIDQEENNGDDNTGLWDEFSQMNYAAPDMSTSSEDTSLDATLVEQDSDKNLTNSSLPNFVEAEVNSK